jgi:hypothetical protein
MQYVTKPEKEPLWDGTPSALADPSYFTRDALQKKFGFELPETRGPAHSEELRRKSRLPYEYGLALSGGGSKAASYAMGVLEGLYVNEVIQHDINAVSSVSGGGYAAFWYYSKLADADLGNQRTITDEPDEAARTELKTPEKSEVSEAQRALPYLFSECLPASYTGLLREGVAVAEGAVTEPGRQRCPEDDPRWVTSEDKWRFQNHLRGYTDVFSNTFELGTESRELPGEIARTLAWTVATFPVHAVANLAFDWHVPLSPSRRQYGVGIERTYGLPPVRLTDGMCQPDILPENSAECTTTRPSPNRLVARGVTFAALRVARNQQQREWDEAQKAIDPENRAPRKFGIPPREPLFIVNTTAGVSHSAFDWLESTFPDFEDSVFEFTPTGYGSRLYGYWPGSHPEVDVTASVSASAAFFDSQQRTMNWPLRAATGSVLRLFQLEWGLDISNPWRPDRTRQFHRLLPFPLYFFHHQTKNSEAPSIHLSDGGQSDNTGIFALVRRGARRIVYADAGQDREGEFRDLCVLRRQLARKQLYLHIPDLDTDKGTFEQDCDRARNMRDARTTPHALWGLRSPVIEGCIDRKRDQTTCARAGNAPEGDYFAKLYILKPSLDMKRLDEAVNACLESGKTGTADAQARFNDSLDTEACRLAYERAAAAQPRLPREVLGFLVRNSNMTFDGHPEFPQHKTWKMTLNSSAPLFGAYKALGRWHVEQMLRAHPSLCFSQNPDLPDVIQPEPYPGARVCDIRHRASNASD